MCCGALLARHGVPVTIIERHNKPGGYATSFAREDGRFVFAVSLHGTSINNNGVARVLDELGVLGKLDLGRFPVEFPKLWEIRDKTLADLRGWLPVMGVFLDDELIEEILIEAESAFEEYVTPAGEMVFDAPAHVLTAEV